MALPLNVSQLGAEPVFIAIDFGTTKSCWAFAVGTEKAPYVAPENEGRKEDTVLLLNRDREHSLHSFGKTAWSTYDGMDEREKKKFLFFDRFKMLLFDDKEVSGDKEIKARGCKHTLPARVVFGRALEYLSRAAINRISEAGLLSVGDDRITWIITVPAIWGDRARAFMEQAAREAKLWKTEAERSRITLALEPEAAAICCREDVLNVWQRCNRPEEEVIRYMMVDCGGGTVDFTVHDLNVESKKMAEVYRATGNEWGGTMVDKKIKELLLACVAPKEQGSMAGVLLKGLTGVFTRAAPDMTTEEINDDDWLCFERNSIDEFKHKANSELQKVRLTVPQGPLGNAIMSASSRSRLPKEVELSAKGRLVFTQSYFKHQFFEPSLAHITDHTQHLLDAIPGINCILLVGGYAECPFLFNRMHEKFNMPTRPVIRPENASLAIVKGAIMFGQNPSVVKTRIARYSYGLAVALPFQNDEHPPSKRLVCDRGEYCTGVFETLVEADQPVSIGEPVERIRKPTYASQTGTEIEIYRSPRKNVQFIDDPECDKLGTIAVQMGNPEKGLDRRLRIQVNFSSTQMRCTAIDGESGKANDVCIEFT